MKLKRKISLITVLVLLIIFLMIPVFVKQTYFIILFDNVFISIIVLIGLNFLSGLMGEINLGTAGIMAMGAYTSALLCTRLHMSPWLGLVGAIVMGLLIGICLGYPSLRMKGIYLALTTLGFAEIVTIIINNLKVTGGTTGIRNIPAVSIFGHELSAAQDFYYFILVCVIIILLITYKIINSKWGRVIKAIKDNDVAVEACGIKTANIKIKVFTLCSIYGCIGGALYSQLNGYICPSDFTLNSSITYLMMLMLGGIGSVPGNIIGAFVITMLPEYLRFLQNYYWLTFSVIILIFSVLLPNGLISLFKALYQRLFDLITRKEGIKYVNSHRNK